MTDPDPHPIYTELAEELPGAPDIDTEEPADDDKESENESG